MSETVYIIAMCIILGGGVLFAILSLFAGPVNLPPRDKAAERYTWDYLNNPIVNHMKDREYRERDSNNDPKR